MTIGNHVGWLTAINSKSQPLEAEVYTVSRKPSEIHYSLKLRDIMAGFHYQRFGNVRFAKDY